MQLITVSAYFAMVNSKPEFQAISESIYPKSEHLMNSVVADLLVSYPALIVIVSLFIFSIYKEAKGKRKANRVFVNVAVLFVFATVFGIASYQVYSPIGVAG